MELIELNSKEYKNYFNKPYHLFNTVNFSELNEDKTEKIYYLVFKTSKVRLGIILGKRENTLYSPFSAPYGGFSFLKEDVSLETVKEAVDLLLQFAKENHLNIKITFPPDFYQHAFITKVINVFFRSAFKCLCLDINHHLSLSQFENYESKITSNGRRNLNIAKTYSLSFEKAVNSEQIKEAYSVIKANREFRGFPLKMKFEDVLKTIKVIPADFFNLYYEGKSIASAQIFHVADKIGQIIYWGDKPGHTDKKPMNYLAFKITEYYRKQGFDFIDIGPSSEDGIPNLGLCEFKESIGASATNKFSFFYEYE